MTRYRKDFMSFVETSATASAAEILPLVYAEIGQVPTAIADVGCGPGAWVRQMLETSDAFGVDGEWARPNLLFEEERFVAHDLSEPLDLGGRRFDLAVSVEVAEHLPPSRSASFVAELCSLADSVLFSAAVPGQIGENHVNCHWQSYWAGLFEEQGYGAIDCIRPILWQRDDVAWWYVQNALLYVRGRDSRLTMPLDVVHPRCLEHRVAEERPGAKLKAGGRRLKDKLPIGLG